MPRLSPLYLLAALALALAAGPAAAQEQDAPSGRKVWVIQPATGVQAPAATPGAAAPQPLAAPAPAAAAPAPAADSTAQVQAGLLECRGEMATAYGLGSSRKVTCEYRPVSGQNQYYSGALNRAGLDFGVSDQASMLWMVLATTPRLGPGALAGEYVGFTSGAAVGPGFSANVLVAKDSTAGIALQPLSVSSDSGLSISLAAASLTLEATTAPKR